MAQDKRHPKTVFNAKYPYNRISIEEAGHEIHLDSTPGYERIRHSHSSGTYSEVSKDGKQVNMVVGNRVEYTKQGKTTTVDKNHDEKIGGSSRVSIHGGSHTEVKGNTTHATDGDHKTMVGGDHVVATKGDVASGVKGKFTKKIGGEIKLKGDDKVHSIIDGAATHEYGSTVSTTAQSDSSEESKTKITKKVGSSTIVMDGSSITLTVGGTFLKIEDGKITMNTPLTETTGNLQIDGTEIGGGST